MGFFDDSNDPFESIVREFFQEARPRTTSSRDLIRSEKEERVIDFIEEDGVSYFVFEIYGYSKEDIKVNVGKGFVEVQAKKKDFENVQDYLINKLSNGITIKKEIPGLKVKDYSWDFKNGILEVRVKTK
ncbi:Hsp20/alpha crystallin family protein [archaeon]|nr:Hsp20/alpha crystallin family protein [archaeon]PJC45448.1 MAG: hypothetical protein CO037_01470 [Candidatus Pacearchaeota archaeon CG_4_9_14_0_2_um_filter_30_8]